MMDADSDKKLMQKAGGMLAHRPYSRGELRARLAAFGEAPQVEAILDRLQQLNLLNDENYSYNLACLWMKQSGWGAIKVRFHLLRRQVPAADIEAAIERVHQEFSEVESLNQYLDRRARSQPMPEDRRGIRKLVGTLRQRGFANETVWSVLRRRMSPSAWKTFDTGD